MIRLFVALLLLLLALPGNALPTPNPTAANGAVTHGSTLVIVGENFGTKATAAPAMWDNAEGANTDNQTAMANRGWTEVLPDRAGAPYDTVYRTVPYRETAAPHTRSTQYIAGGHKASDSVEACEAAVTDRIGGNVAFSMTFGEDSDTVYASWYERVDPAWPENYVTTPEWNNFKSFYLSSTGLTVDDPHYYLANVINYAPEQSSSNRILGWPYPTCAEGNGVECICPTPWEQNPANYDSGYDATNIKTAWIKREVIFYHVTTAGEGYWKAWADGKVQWEPTLSGTATPTDSTCAFWTATVCDAYDCDANPEYAHPSGVVMGGYWRDKVCLTSRAYGDNNAFRYFDDIYVDKTVSRVMLCNHRTLLGDGTDICEPQIPSAWADTEITVTVNLGALENTGSAYLFVYDSANSVNASGREVTLGAIESIHKGRITAGAFSGSTR